MRNANLYDIFLLNATALIDFTQMNLISNLKQFKWREDGSHYYSQGFL